MVSFSISDDGNNIDDDDCGASLDEDDESKSVDPDDPPQRILDAKSEMVRVLKKSYTTSPFFNSSIVWCTPYVYAIKNVVDYNQVEGRNVATIRHNW